jgi:hypothetical protein
MRVGSDLPCGVAELGYVAIEVTEFHSCVQTPTVQLDRQSSPYGSVQVDTLS